LQKRLTLVLIAILLAGIGLLPVLTMVVDSFFVGGAFSLNRMRKKLLLDPASI
jgi:hypothetical protein